jgi:hypothetical protein
MYRNAQFFFNLKIMITLLVYGDIIVNHNIKHFHTKQISVHVYVRKLFFAPKNTYQMLAILHSEKYFRGLLSTLGDLLQNFHTLMSA